MADTNSIFRYFLREYYDGDIDRMVTELGFNRNDLIAWCEDKKVPQNRTVKQLLSPWLEPAFLLEFKVIKEFFEFDSTARVSRQLKEMYKGHERRSGIYAFYDSMANLQYVGKAKNLLAETYYSIKKPYELVLPVGIKNKNIERYKVVRYISAYDIERVNEFDYPKHVESLILRISKPPMNKQSGRLKLAM